MHHFHCNNVRSTEFTNYSNFTRGTRRSFLLYFGEISRCFPQTWLDDRGTDLTRITISLLNGTPIRWRCRNKIWRETHHLSDRETKSKWTNLRRTGKVFDWMSYDIDGRKEKIVRNETVNNQISGDRSGLTIEKSARNSNEHIGLLGFVAILLVELKLLWWTWLLIHHLSNVKLLNREKLLFTVS